MNFFFLLFLFGNLFFMINSIDFPDGSEQILSEEPTKCLDGWVYNEDTTYCYYLQNFTYSDGVHWDLYDWTTAERNCQLIADDTNAHLVSIHSHDENAFIKDLITSNVANLSNAAPNNNPCDYQWAWIGYYGDGRLGTGNWTDGSPVDFLNRYISDPFWWAISNDPSCGYKWWNEASQTSPLARFVCKLPAKQ